MGVPEIKNNRSHLSLLKIISGRSYDAIRIELAWWRWTWANRGSPLL